MVFNYYVLFPYSLVNGLLLNKVMRTQVSLTCVTVCFHGNSSGGLGCLENEPRGMKERENNESLPGMLYTADQQCEMSLRRPALFCPHGNVSL